jgi:hypothetical protein
MSFFFVNLQLVLKMNDVGLEDKIYSYKTNLSLSPFNKKHIYL